MGPATNSPSRDAQRKVAQKKLIELYDSAKNFWPGFQERKAQKRAMAAMLDTLMDYTTPGSTTTGKNIAVLEAGTGFGKTVGYGLPALAAAFATGKNIVISTATVALQEQLYDRDLPRLADVAARTGFEFTVALLKGRQRYLCTERLDLELLNDATQPAPKEVEAASAQTKRVELYGTLRKAFMQKQWSGDRDQWPETIDDATWRRMQADRGTCTGRRCKSYSSCAFYAARAGAKQAKVIVANHSLVLATLANEASLFDPAETFFIFDEGHHLDAIGTQFFAPRYGVESARRSLEVIEKQVQRAARLTRDPGLLGAQSDFAASIQALAQQHNALADELLESPLFVKAATHRFPNGVLPDYFQVSGGNLQPLIQRVLDIGIDAMNALRDSLGKSDDTARNQITRVMVDLGPSVLRLQTMGDLWKQWMFHGKVPRAKWIEVDTSGRDREIVLCAAAMTSAGDLSAKLWSKVGAALITSATLKVTGTFDYFRRTTGLARLPDVVELEAESPFDYQTQGQIHIVQTRTSPDAQAAFAAEVQQLMPRHLAHGGRGQLALFSSRRQMIAVYEALPEDLKEKVLMQDQLPKSQLLAEHRRRIEQGGESIIFGMQSFGEGVDLQGDDCTNVYIDKIPFKPPGGPTEEALSEWLRSQGRDPFTEVAIPQAAQTLKQWVGRAIRSPTDQAVVTFFDPRLLTKRYGADLLSSLPPMPVYTVAA